MRVGSECGTSHPFNTATDRFGDGLRETGEKKKGQKNKMQRWLVKAVCTDMI